mgnify:CR=1 FL=1
MITLTQNAAAAVKTAIAQSSEAVEGMRIRVEEGGCAGFKYTMKLESEALEHDLIVEQGGVKLFIDERSQLMLRGMQIDFVTSLHSSGFVFENPNASNQCGCGKSFS